MFLFSVSNADWHDPLDKVIQSVPMRESCEWGRLQWMNKSVKERNTATAVRKKKMHVFIWAEIEVML